MACTRIAAEVRRLVLQNPQVLQLRPYPVGDLYFTIHIAATASVMWVSGGPSATVHHNEHIGPPDNDKETQHMAETIGAAHLLGIAGMLARFSALGPAARLAAKALEHGTIGDPRTAGETVALLFDAGRLDDALDAVGTFMHSGDPELTESALSATIWATGRLDDDQTLKIADRLEEWADRHAAAGDPVGMAGTLTYNAANFCGRSDRRRTLRLYDLAAERDPAYRRRGYWHREKAGILFHCGDYAQAVARYQDAVDLGDERSRPLLADTLLLTGQYANALSLFQEIEGTEHDQPEWLLKRHLLAHLVATYGVREQDRQSQRARETAGATDDPDVLGRVLAEYDLLCGHAHWKLAQYAYDHAAPSFEQFLAVTVAEPDHPAAWLNALLRSFAEHPELVPEVAKTARRMAGQQALDMLLATGDPEDHELAQRLDTLFHSLPDDGPPPAELRQVGPNPEDVISTRLDFSKPLTPDQMDDGD